MNIIVTFTKDRDVLTRYEHEVIDPEDYSIGITEAHRVFRIENPKISLFDGVSVTFDRD